MARNVQSEKEKTKKAPAAKAKTKAAAGARLGKNKSKCAKVNQKDQGNTKKRTKGQPAKFTTPKTMADRIDVYFEGLKGEGNIPDRPPTMAGLALALGFLDRQSLRDYSERNEDYSCLIKKARLKIEAHHEERISGTNCTGSICWLNNHAGYTTKSEIEHKGTVKIIATELDEKL
jgi:hypothetical protein